jgi:hypothetical protein
VGNSMVEGHRSLTVELDMAVNAELGSPSTATLQILDDDSPLPTVGFASSSFATSESSVYATIEVSLSEASAFIVTVNYSVADGDEPNGAVAPHDYLTTDGVLYFLPGETSKTFDVEIIPDDLDAEGQETAKLLLDAPTNADPGLFTADLFIQDGTKPQKPTAADIDPVSYRDSDPNDPTKKLIIRPKDPLNKIPNPAAIIVDATTEKTAAMIEAINILPQNAKPEDLEWKIKNVKDKDGSDYPAGEEGPPRAKFLNDKNMGRVVYVHGLKDQGKPLEGRVRISVWNKGEGAKELDYYEAWVVAPRILYFRVNILRGPGPNDGNLFTQEAIENHVEIAKRYFYQVGILLTEDPMDTVIPEDMGEKIKQGYFKAKPKEKKYVDAVIEADAEAETMRINYRAEICQINYIRSFKDGALGFAPFRPINTKYGEVQPDWNVLLTFRRKLARDSLKDHSMTLQTKNLHGTRATNWGAIVSSQAGDPLANMQKYGMVIAHELGHVLKLSHRGSDGMGTDTIDGRNIMYDTEQRNTVPSDFDLIQLEGMRYSKALVTPP